MIRYNFYTIVQFWYLNVTSHMYTETTKETPRQQALTRQSSPFVTVNYETISFVIPDLIGDPDEWLRYWIPVYAGMTEKGVS